MNTKKKREKTVLVLQGGGALGAYQAGAAATLEESGQYADWVAGISIGAINAALIAGNAPEKRTEILRAFWKRITAITSMSVPFFGFFGHQAFNIASATSTMMLGAPGFFKPRFPPPSCQFPGTIGATSYYDTSGLRETLLEFVDFELLNSGKTRFSVGAVNVATGNMTWFDNAHQTIRPEHVMASGALPPGFPAVEIDGEFYWDGGLVSNTPLQYVLDDQFGSDDLCVFQIDLFNARGPVPRSILSIDAREKDIRFSSRTRFNTDMMKRLHQTRDAARRLYDKLPKELRDDPDARALVVGNADPRVSIVHLIYRQAKYEGGSKDYEFSRSSMIQHWDAGQSDTRYTLEHPEWRKRNESRERVQVFDLSCH
mgnify:CR=1 FL=1